MLSTRSPVDHGHRPVSSDTSLVVSGGVDCERSRRNVYYKKPQRYAKDNRTAHLTARSDKSVAYVTNNKRLYLTFCTVEANYWQTRSIARPLCDSRATCFSQVIATTIRCHYCIIVNLSLTCNKLQLYHLFTVKQQNVACLADIKSSETEHRSYCRQLDTEVRYDVLYNKLCICMFTSRHWVL